MKVALFSDMHANREAYEAVLAAIAKEGIDQWYCAGDIVGYGADPVACIDKTRALPARTVAGNHDWGAAGAADIGRFNRYAKEALLWTAGVLDDGAREYLRALPLVEKREFLLVHGSLSRPEDFEYIVDFQAAQSTFLLMKEERVCFVGHTHVAGVFIDDGGGQIEYNPWPEVTLEDGKRYIVNIGSVGQPRDNDPRAAYCLYDIGRKNIQIKRVRYDVRRAQEKIRKAGLPQMLAQRLETGR